MAEIKALESSEKHDRAGMGMRVVSRKYYQSIRGNTYVLA